ncbi:hypothetical protein EVAR_60516_1 [Eumeta japonica]|uniref:Uncharacterized protein n=1 Tax=Eumeta variegata TaxID=151549 RepID=A0A4C1ZJG8_EUMVA|nr:hypothetical protein EVAR_60516_1 [Eumeta japonica]
MSNTLHFGMLAKCKHGASILNTSKRFWTLRKVLRNVSVVAFHQISESYGDSLPSISPFLLPSDILFLPKTGNALVTPLRVFMDSSDHLLSVGSHARLSLENAIKKVLYLVNTKIYEHGGRLAMVNISLSMSVLLIDCRAYTLVIYRKCTGVKGTSKAIINKNAQCHHEHKASRCCTRCHI